jgi:hypothetical protein
VAGAEADDAALRMAALERSLKGAKPVSYRGTVEEVPLAGDERTRAVREAFDAAFPVASRKPGEPLPTQQEMEARLAARQQVPADAYQSLAAERSQRAREALLAAGVDPGRLFLVQGGERAAKEKGARVYFSVR